MGGVHAFLNIYLNCRSIQRQVLNPEFDSGWGSWGKIPGWWVIRRKGLAELKFLETIAEGVAAEA
jgi:hypothetical protein